MIPLWVNHFGKITAWSLIYFLNYAQFDILTQSQILVLTLYIFSCCCGCCRIGSSRSVPPKYSLERKKKKTLLVKNSTHEGVILQSSHIPRYNDWLSKTHRLTASDTLHCIVCIQKLLIRSWLHYVPRSYTNILPIRVRKGNM